MTFAQFLEWASGPGVAAIVAVLLSVAVEYWPWYGQLQPKSKRLVFAGLSLAVPVSAALVRVAAEYVPLSFDPLIWDALVAGVAALGAGTLAHTRGLKVGVPTR